MRISTFEGYYPAVAIDGAGNLHLAWEVKVTDAAIYAIFYARVDPNGKWTTPVRISGTTWYAEVPDIAVKRSSGTGLARIVVVFQSRTDDTHYQLNMVESADGGATWSK